MSDQRISIGPLVKDITGIRALVIAVMPDCLLFDSWKHDEEKFEPEDVASYFGTSSAPTAKGCARSPPSPRKCRSPLRPETVW